MEEVKAVRAMVIELCEIYGMHRLQNNDKGNWGWRTDVADL